MNNTNPLPFYLVVGTEPFFIEEAKQKVIQSFLPEEDLDFNLATYDAAELPLDAALDDAETLPFIGDYRIVIIQNSLFLTGQKEKTKVEHDFKRLEKYLTNPSPQTIMIFIAPYEKLDDRKKIVKLLKQAGEVIVAKPLDEKTVRNWITKRFNQRKVMITDAALDFFIEMVGTSLMLLTNEIDKISLYVSEGGKVDEEIIFKLVAKTTEQNVFALTDKVMTRQLADALAIYYDLLERKEEPVKLLALISQQFRLIYQVKTLAKLGYGQNQIAGQLKVHPFRIKLASSQVKYFSETELLAILDQLAELDYTMKTGKMDKMLALELFFIKWGKAN